MSLFHRYKRPIAEITGLRSRPSAASLLFRKNAEEMVSMYVEGSSKSQYANLYSAYFNPSDRTMVSYIFFRGGNRFGAWALRTIVQDLNAMAEKYGLQQRVALVNEA